MIYNLYEYLNTALPELNIVVEQLDESDLQDTILLSLTSSKSQAYPSGRVDEIVKVRSFSNNEYDAKKNAELIYNTLKENYNFYLPASPGNAYHSGTLRINVLQAMQKPVFVGYAPNNTAIYTFDYKVIYSDNQ